MDIKTAQCKGHHKQISQVVKKSEGCSKRCRMTFLAGVKIRTRFFLNCFRHRDRIG